MKVRCELLNLNQPYNKTDYNDVLIVKDDGCPYTKVIIEINGQSMIVDGNSLINAVKNCMNAR